MIAPASASRPRTKPIRFSVCDLGGVHLGGYRGAVRRRCLILQFGSSCTRTVLIMCRMSLSAFERQLSAEWSQPTPSMAGSPHYFNISLQQICVVAAALPAIRCDISQPATSCGFFCFLSKPVTKQLSALRLS
jgi:hypothetical protein